MGKRGPKRRPSSLEKAAGNPGKRAKGGPEPTYRTTNSKPPNWITDRNAVGKWRELYPLLVRSRVMTDADRDALALLCWTFGEFRKVAAFVQKYGSVMAIKTPQGVVKYLQQYPQVTIARQHLTTYHRLLCEFGLTPSARAGMQISGSQAVPLHPSDPDNFDDMTFDDAPPTIAPVIE